MLGISCQVFVNFTSSILFDNTKKLVCISISLRVVLKEKINFLLGFGLLKNIPFVGEFVHNLVERDPEGVSKALSGGIMAVAGLVLGNLNIG